MTIPDDVYRVAESLLIILEEQDLISKKEAHNLKAAIAIELTRAREQGYALGKEAGRREGIEQAANVAKGIGVIGPHVAKEILALLTVSETNTASETEGTDGT